MPCCCCCCPHTLLLLCCLLPHTALQVSETSIAGSIDVLLSGEVPIALRLSGQLLLGLVRIYRKQVGAACEELSMNLCDSCWLGVSERVCVCVVAGATSAPAATVVRTDTAGALLLLLFVILATVVILVCYMTK